MQYDSGYISSIAGTTVTGVGVVFSDNVTPGDLFTIVGSGVFYEVSAVVDDTHLTLAAEPPAISGSYDYKITRDFTPYFKFAEIQTGTTNWMSLITMNFRMIDLVLEEYKNRLHDLDGL